MDRHTLTLAELTDRAEEIQAEAWGRSLPTARLAHLIAHLFTPDPPPFYDLPPAQRETLHIIQAEPGVNVSEIARRREVTPRAALNAVTQLERAGLIRTELITEGQNIRACYPVEAP